MVAASRTRGKKAQSRKGAETDESLEAMPQATQPVTQQENAGEEASTSKPVRIYADGG